MKGREDGKLRKRMRKNKLAWILMTAVLCLLLYSIVVMRSDNRVSVIVGGTDGAFIQSDGHLAGYRYHTNTVYDGA